MALGTTLGILSSITSTPGFSNTYSMEFDGVDDHVSMGNGVSFEYTDAFSYSFWITPDVVAGVKYLYSKYDSGKGILMYYNSSGAATPAAISFNLYNTNAGSTATRKRITTATGNILTKGVWNNIVITYDGSGLGSGIKLYKNGAPQTVTVTQDNLQNNTILNSSDSYLGAFNGISSFLTGKLDEFAIYNTELSSADALAIYNSGAPADLTDLSPIAWYRMGDNGDYKSPQWLIPNNENKDKVSNYSFKFDGVDDYIDCGNISELNGVTKASWSIWAAKGDTTDDYLMSCYSSTSSLQQYLFHQYSDKLYVYLSNSGGTLRLMNRIDYTFNIDEWYHIGIVYNEAEVSNADKVKVYINGTLQANQQVGFALTSLRSTTASTNIGRATDFTTKEYNGKIDEVAVFDSAISIGDVWDGSGQPIDVSAVSGIVSYYRMGEEATFSGGVWTLPDAIGSNNGTSNAMTIEDRVGSAPSSSNNAVSFNMDLIDRVTDVPI